MPEHDNDDKNFRGDRTWWVLFKSFIYEVGVIWIDCHHQTKQRQKRHCINKGKVMNWTIHRYLTGHQRHVLMALALSGQRFVSPTFFFSSAVPQMKLFNSHRWEIHIKSTCFYNRVVSETLMPRYQTGKNTLGFCWTEQWTDFHFNHHVS